VIAEAKRSLLYPDRAGDQRGRGVKEAGSKTSGFVLSCTLTEELHRIRKVIENLLV
jgi:hypothetical protein